MTGLETWFTLPGQPGAAPPPPYKMALRHLDHDLPADHRHRRHHGADLEDLPLAVRLGITTALTVPLMTWVVMPRVTWPASPMAVSRTRAATLPPMTEPDKPAPTLYMGRRRVGDQAADGLLYDRVERDELLSPYFPGGVSEKHRAHVSTWWSEVLGGPARYTEDLGGYENMLARHRGLVIAPEERHRFVSLLSFAADDAGLPDDPEFRSALVAYAEWGSRLAMHNSSRTPRSSSTHRSLAGAGVRRRPFSPRGGRSQLRCLGRRLLFVQSRSTALSRRRSLKRSAATNVSHPRADR